MCAFHYWSAPTHLHSEHNAVTAVTFDRMHVEHGQLTPTGETYTLPTDMVLKAIGQTLDVSVIGTAFTMTAGRLWVDESRHTSCPGI